MRIDNLDVLHEAVDGVRQAGAPVEIDGCDLAERWMYVRVFCEQVRALAQALLARGTGARSLALPRADNPVVFAEFIISENEAGCGTFTLPLRERFAG